MICRSGQHIEEDEGRRDGGKERLDAETNTINSGHHQIFIASDIPTGPPYKVEYGKHRLGESTLT